MKHNSDDQFVLEGTLRPSKSGGDVIVFYLNLGFLTLTFIVTVPMEGTEKGPVYVKWEWANDLVRKWHDPNFRP